ncbi:uncharacterized protein [Macrobrachium rosenbergii]|uniref:uncharacterized protein n=1 Tax=Macrobrachium rosenbergii TaxID=79674 RepID=UPI0034D5CA23
MAFFGALSCSTSIGQTVVFGLISAAMSSLCSVDDSVCCTCTTVVYRVSPQETEIVEETVTPPFILTALFPWLFGVRRRYYDDDRSGGGRGLRLPRARFPRDSYSNTTTQESCDCTFSRAFQYSLGAFFLASLPTLVASCSVPATPITNAPPQTQQIFIPQLPPRPEPVTPLISFLLPGDRGPAFHTLGENLEDDGCPRSEVLIEGVCAKLLKSVPPCPPPQWVVLNATTKPSQGTCGTRLCGRGRVFLVSDQLCHDVREPGICPEDKRLYVTAFGSPVCDCYEGEIPDGRGVCHPILSQGPCSPGEIWGPDLESQSFKCQPQRCPFNKEKIRGRPLGQVLFEDGRCHHFGSEVPCQIGEFLGFSLSRLKAVCTTLRETRYEEHEEIAALLHELYPTFAPPSFLLNSRRGVSNSGLVKRQVSNLVSNPVVPSLRLNISPTPGTILETPLLTQCRPGAQRDVNFKCRDVILGPNIDNVPRGVHAPPVPPLQSCPPNQCFNDMAKCVSCNQALVDTCVLSATIRLQQTSCQAIATGLG